jgi:hypothetical protein
MEQRLAEVTHPADIAAMNRTMERLIMMEADDDGEPKQPTAEGIRHYSPDGRYTANDEDGTPCTCKVTCPYNCKGQCGCEACSEAYGDFLSDE